MQTSLFTTWLTVSQANPFTKPILVALVLTVAKIKSFLPEATIEKIAKTELAKALLNRMEMLK